MQETMANNMEAFLKARGKNHAEEVRLQHILATFELEKRQWERRVFNETYEQRKQAYNLKRDADDVLRKRKNSKQKNRKGECDEPQEGEDNVDGSFELPQLKSTNVGQADMAGNTLGLFDTTEILPLVHKKHNRNQNQTEGKLTKPNTYLPDLSNDENKDKGKYIVNGTNKPEMFAKAVETLMTRQREDKLGKIREHQVSSTWKGGTTMAVPRMTGENRSGPTESSSKKVKLANLISRLFPKSLRRARSMADLEALKETPHVDGAATDRTLEGAEGNRDVPENLDEELPPLDLSVLKREHWIGDPKAIGSVRRPRLPPEMMSARSKNVGEVMKLIRDLPVYPSCSRNCNKPGARFEEVPGEQNMLPSLVIANVARHYMKSRTSSMETINAVAASQVVSFPAVQDTTLTTTTVQKKIEEEELSLRTAAEGDGTTMGVDEPSIINRPIPSL